MGICLFFVSYLGNTTNSILPETPCSNYLQNSLLGSGPNLVKLQEKDHMK